MLLDYVGFLVGFLEKWMKSTNLGKFGVLRCGVVIPCSSIGPCQGVACPCRGVVERKVWTSSGTSRHSRATPRRSSTPQRSSATLRHSYYSQYGNFCVLFCFVFPLLRGLFYWTNEDPISA